MEQWRRNGLILWFGCFLAAAGYSLVMPFLPLFIKQLGVVEHLETWAGATFAVTFLSSTIMSPVWGNMADRYGRKIMILRSGISIAVVYFFMSLVQNHYQLFGLRFLNGLFSGFIPSAIALMATNTPREWSGRALATLATAAATGSLTGPLIGGALADAIGIRQSLQVASLMMLVSTLLVLFGVRETVRGAAGPRTSVLADLRTAWDNRSLRVLMITLMLVQASVMSVEPILTLHLQGLAQEPWLTQVIQALFGRRDAVNLLSGAIFSLPALAMVIAARAWARRGERVGFPAVMATGLLLGGAFVVPQSLATTALQLGILRLAYGLCQAAVLPSVNATIAQVVPTEFRGRAYGITTSAQFIGAVTGPILGGLVASTFGTRALFISTGVLLMLASVWVRRQLRRPAVATS